MSKLKPFLWIYEAVLVIGFMKGLFMFGDPDMPRIALYFGLALNLLLQYTAIKAIRRKPVEQPPPTEQLIIKARQKLILRMVFLGAGALAVVMLINVGLFTKHVYTARTFAFVQMVAVAIFFCYFVISFRRLQKETGIGISNGR